MSKKSKEKVKILIEVEISVVKDLVVVLFQEVIDDQVGF